MWHKLVKMLADDQATLPCNDCSSCKSNARHCHYEHSLRYDKWSEPHFLTSSFLLGTAESSRPWRTSNEANTTCDQSDYWHCSVHVRPLDEVGKREIYDCEEHLKGKWWSETCCPRAACDPRKLLMQPSRDLGNSQREESKVFRCCGGHRHAYKYRFYLSMRGKQPQK